MNYNLAAGLGGLAVANKPSDSRKLSPQDRSKYLSAGLAKLEQLLLDPEFIRFWRGGHDEVLEWGSQTEVLEKLFDLCSSIEENMKILAAQAYQLLLVAPSQIVDVILKNCYLEKHLSESLKMIRRKSQVDLRRMVLSRYLRLVTIYLTQAFVQSKLLEELEKVPSLKSLSEYCEYCEVCLFLRSLLVFEGKATWQPEILKFVLPSERLLRVLREKPFVPQFLDLIYSLSKSSVYQELFPGDELRDPAFVRAIVDSFLRLHDPNMGELRSFWQVLGALITSSNLDFESNEKLLKRAIGELNQRVCCESWHPHVLRFLSFLVRKEPFASGMLRVPLHTLIGILVEEWRKSASFLAAVGDFILSAREGEVGQGQGEPPAQRLSDRTFEEVMAVICRILQDAEFPQERVALIGLVLKVGKKLRSVPWPDGYNGVWDCLKNALDVSAKMIVGNQYGTELPTLNQPGQLLGLDSEDLLRRIRID